MPIPTKRIAAALALGVAVVAALVVLLAPPDRPPLPAAPGQVPPPPPPGERARPVPAPTGGVDAAAGPAAPLPTETDRPQVPQQREFTPEQQAQLDEINARVNAIGARLLAIDGEVAAATLAATRSDSQARELAARIASLQQQLRGAEEALPGRAEAIAKRDEAEARAAEVAGRIRKLHAHAMEHGVPTDEDRAAGRAQPEPRADCEYCRADFDRLVARDRELGRRYSELLEGWGFERAKADREALEARAAVAELGQKGRAENAHLALLLSEARAARSNLDARVQSLPGVATLVAERTRLVGDRTAAIAERMQVYQAGRLVPLAGAAGAAAAGGRGAAAP